MKILNTEQIRNLDSYTIENELIMSLHLMERASLTFVNWFENKFQNPKNPITIFCGPGNNGGDGLAIARLLCEKNFEVRVVVCEISRELSNDCQINLRRLRALETVPILKMRKGDVMPEIEAESIVIDAIFGSGLNRSVGGFWGELLTYLNRLDITRISVDIPSGLFADKHSDGVVFEADYTFSFEMPKLGFLFPENQNRVGEFIFQSIGLNKTFIQNAKTKSYLIDNQIVGSILKKRKKYDHKGTFGHALIVAGGYGKIGAAILASKACLRSGAGLVTIHAPKCAYSILQISFPEAMVSVDEHEYCISKIQYLKSYTSIGIGCGTGTSELTQKALKGLIEKSQVPLVLDADALNILSDNISWLKRLPKNSILTPHPKEFERLFGKFKNDFERNKRQRELANELNIYLILKGANTCIACPDGTCYFNSTGNPGMATGGSGDVLTGILTGLLAQGYSSFEASVMGVYLHGLAGDIAEIETQQEALLASDIIGNIGKGFKKLRNGN